ncbi:MAG: flagellar export protein FliJ [Lachnospiraceae bacterium]|nr:flagellar export protein FliJ [Lachnospiraceae bacterium]
MAKFKYRMQSILNIKEKLEEQAKNEFAQARLRLDEEEEKLKGLYERKASYEEEGRHLRESALNILDLNENKNAIDRMDEFIAAQQIEVNKAAALLEQARINLQNAMQESQIHNKLKEKAFDQFKKDLVAQESKEVDELTSYTYGARLKEEET